MPKASGEKGSEVALEWNPPHPAIRKGVSRTQKAFFKKSPFALDSGKRNPYYPNRKGVSNIFFASAYLWTS
jgi:hypothetical protein